MYWTVIQKVDICPFSTISMAMELLNGYSFHLLFKMLYFKGLFC